MKRITSTHLILILAIALLSFIGCGGDGQNPDPRLEMIDLINAERAANGLNELQHNLDLSGVAQAHASDMVARDFLDHINPDGLDFFMRVDNAGITYSGLGENVSAGFTSILSAHEAFMNSPTHRNNILIPNATDIGVGYEWGTLSNQYGQTLYICVLFMEQ